MVSSDHLAVYASFNTNTIFERQSLVQLKQHKICHCVFSHDNTTDDDWIQFSAISNHNLKDIKNMVINNQIDLDYYWNLIQKGILNAAYENLPHHYTSDRQQALPEDIDLLKRNIRFINKILHSYLHPKNFRNPNIAFIRRKWPSFKRPISAISEEYHISFTWIDNHLLRIFHEFGKNFTIYYLSYNTNMTLL